MYILYILYIYGFLSKPKSKPKTNFGLLRKPKFRFTKETKNDVFGVMRKPKIKNEIHILTTFGNQNKMDKRFIN